MSSLLVPAGFYVLVLLPHYLLQLLPAYVPLVSPPHLHCLATLHLRRHLPSRRLYLLQFLEYSALLVPQVDLIGVSAQQHHPVIHHLLKLPLHRHQPAPQLLLVETAAVLVGVLVELLLPALHRVHLPNGLQVRLQQRVQLIHQLREINPTRCISSQHFLHQVAERIRIAIPHPQQPARQLALVESYLPLVGRVLEYLLAVVQQTHRQSQQSHAKNICLFMTERWFFGPVLEVGQIFGRQVIENLSTYCTSSLFRLEELECELVVAFPGEGLAIDQHEAAVLVDEQLLGAECGVGDVEVVQEVNCADDVIDHADHLYFLVVDIDRLPCLRRQFVDLRVVPHLHRPRLRHHRPPVPLPQLLQLPPPRLQVLREAAIGREVLEVYEDEGFVLLGAARILRFC